MSAATRFTTARIAAIQMVSGPAVAGNLDEAGRLIEIAAARGAQLVALRLAVILCHARRDPDLSGITLASLPGGKLQLTCAARWAQEFPQSAHLLREESIAWQKTPWPMDFIEI